MPAETAIAKDPAGPEAPLWDEAEREAWRPPPALTPSEWAERYRILPRDQSNLDGPWRNEHAPYLAILMDLPLRPGIVQVNVQKPAQIGASEAMRNLIGYMASQSPDPMGLTLPGEKKGRQIVADRILPLFRKTPVLAALTSDRSHDLKTGQITLANGFRLHLMWAGSASSMASDPMRMVVNDEVDKFEPWTGREADPIALTRKRLITYGDRACQINLSTPTTSDGVIARLVEESTVALAYRVPCPRCGAFQELQFSRLKWRKDWPEATRRSPKRLASAVARAGAVWYECEACGGRIEASERDEIVGRGVWSSPDGAVPDAAAVEEWPPETSVGLRLSALVCRWVKWSTVAGEFIKAAGAGDRSALYAFFTQTLGVAFEHQVEKTEVSHGARLSAAAPLDEGVVPAWAAGLLMTADTQQDHFWAVVRAWGPGMRSARVWHGRLETFADLDEMAARRWPVEGGQGEPMSVSRLLIDSGGTREEGGGASRTMEVYQYARARRSWVYPIKGAKRARGAVHIWRGRGWLDVESRQKRRGKHTTLWFFDRGHFADELAEHVHGRILAGDGGEASAGAKAPADRRWFLNRRDDPEYNRHLAAMHKVEIRRGRTHRQEWVPRPHGGRHDLWDCELYQLVAAYLAKVHLLPSLEEFLRLREPSRSAPAAEPGPPAATAPPEKAESEPHKESPWIGPGFGIRL